jgi:hypothetical protein
MDSETESDADTEYDEWSAVAAPMPIPLPKLHPLTQSVEMLDALSAMADDVSRADVWRTPTMETATVRWVNDRVCATSSVKPSFIFHVRASIIVHKTHVESCVLHCDLFFVFADFCLTASAAPPALAARRPLADRRRH